MERHRIEDEERRIKNDKIRLFEKLNKPKKPAAPKKPKKSTEATNTTQEERFEGERNSSSNLPQH